LKKCAGLPSTTIELKLRLALVLLAYRTNWIWHFIFSDFVVLCCLRK